MYDINKYAYMHDKLMTNKGLTEHDRDGGEKGTA